MRNGKYLQRWPLDFSTRFTTQGWSQHYLGGVCVTWLMLLKGDVNYFLANSSVQLTKSLSLYVLSIIT
jgi:hypothetical protein